MKKTLLTIALAAATMPFSFGQTAPAPAAQNDQTQATKPAKKHVKKARKSHKKAAEKTTTNTAPAPTK